MSRLVTLGEVLRHRKGSIIIDDAVEYKRCRVQLHRRGVEVRDIVAGTVIRTKKQQVCKAGDFIVAEMDAKFGGYGFLNESLDGAIVSSHYYLFEVITERMLPEYLAVINKTDILQNQIKAKGSTNYSAVRPVDVLGWKIPLPSKVEQRRIIEQVEVTEKEQQLLLPEFEYQLTHLAQLRQALLREAMQGQLLPQDPTDEPASLLLKKLQAAKAATGKGGKGKAGALFAEEAEEVVGPFEIPSSWVWCKMEYLYSQLLGGLAFESSKYTKGESNNQVLRLGNVKNDCLLLDAAPVFIDEEYATAANSARLKPDDILITMTGTRAKKDYLFSLKLSEEDFTNKALFLNQRVGCFRFPAGISASFINCLLKDRRFLAPVFDSATGAANQANVGIGALKAITIPLPPLAEQRRIVAKLEQLLQHCDAMEQRIRESRRLAEQLLQTALREALAPPAGTKSTVEAEPALAPAEASAPAPSRQGRPRRPAISLANPSLDLFDELL